jgi:hypothetical protein
MIHTMLECYLLCANILSITPSLSLSTTLVTLCTVVNDMACIPRPSVVVRVFQLVDSDGPGGVVGGNGLSGNRNCWLSVRPVNPKASTRHLHRRIISTRRLDVLHKSLPSLPLPIMQHVKLPLQTRIALFRVIRLSKSPSRTRPRNLTLAGMRLIHLLRPGSNVRSRLEVFDQCLRWRRHRDRVLL